MKGESTEEGVHTWTGRFLDRLGAAPESMHARFTDATRAPNCASFFSARVSEEKRKKKGHQSARN